MLQEVAWFSCKFLRPKIVFSANEFGYPRQASVIKTETNNHVNNMNVDLLGLYEWPVEYNLTFLSLLYHRIELYHHYGINMIQIDI